MKNGQRLLLNYCVLVVLMFSFLLGKAQKTPVDSLKQVLSEYHNKAQSPTRGSVKAAIFLSDFYSKVSLDSATLYARLGKQLAMELKYDTGIAIAYNMIGMSFLSSGKYDSAYPYMDTALMLFGKMNDTTGLVFVRNNLAVAYMRKGLYTEAIALYHDNLNVAKQRGELQNMLLTYNNIGIAYFDWKKYDEAFRYYQLALQVVDSLGNDTRKGAILNNLGELFLEKGDQEKALTYFTDALTIHRTEGRQRSVMISMMNISDIYMQQGKSDEALSYLTEALAISQKIPDHYNAALLNIRIGRYYLSKEEVSKAYRFLSDGLSLAQENKLKNTELEAKLGLMDYARAINDADLLYQYSQSYIELNDTLFNQKSLESISEMETKFKTAEKEKEIAVLHIEQQKKDLEIQLQRNQKYLFVIGLLVLLFAIVLLFNRNRLRQIREKSELEKLKSDIEKRLLRSQMNPHFIFNSLNSINSFVGENNTVEAQRYLGKFARLMRMILENSRKTMISLEDEIASLRLNLELEQLRFAGNFDFNITTDQEIEPEDIFLSPMLIQPFVENAVLHGLNKNQSGGLITIHFSLNGKLLFCTINDNGQGRNFTENVSQKSTEGHVSLGSQVTLERLALLKSESSLDAGVEIIDLKHDDGTASGTRVVVRMPFERE